MQKMMKQAQKMQAQMMKAQEEIASKEIDGVAGGGMVKVTLAGSMQLKNIVIDPEAVDPDDVEMLEDLIMAAYHNAAEEVQKLNESTFGPMTAGLGIPGL